MLQRNLAKVVRCCDTNWPTVNFFPFSGLLNQLVSAKFVCRTAVYTELEVQVIH